MPADKFVEDEIHWPSEWDDEVERATRYPRRAAHFEAGLRRVDLADAIGVTRATISRIESGESPASFAEPPRRGALTGWGRHATLPDVPRWLQERTERGELPIDDPIYD